MHVVVFRNFGKKKISTNVDDTFLTVYVLVPRRTPVDSRVPTGASLSSNDQFHRETTGTRQPTTESSSNGDSTDQWEAPVPQRGQRPSAPPRQSSQTERTVSTTTTERPTRPPVQTTHQFSEPDVDYHGFPVDEFATSEPTVDQFADYDIFEDRKCQSFL